MRNLVCKVVKNYLPAVCCETYAPLMSLDKTRHEFLKRANACLWFVNSIPDAFHIHICPLIIYDSFRAEQRTVYVKENLLFGMDETTCYRIHAGSGGWPAIIRFAREIVHTWTRAWEGRCM